MKQMQRVGREDAVRDITTGIGSGFLREFFSGKNFLHCLIELIKNPRDYGAMGIWIFTNIARETFRIVDDGEGMGEANRNSFSSVNLTTAKRKGQAGKFGTGTKQMLFSHAVRVEVRTAPKDDPAWVYIFGFSADEYERLAFNQGHLPLKRVTKTKDTWPYEHDFGTEITYLLREPKSRAIYRGESLAQELSARLPLKFGEFVYVDGARIPPKEIIGTRFEHEEMHKQLGPVVFELYRPQRPHQDEDLRLTAVEIGEASIKSLFQALNGEPRNRFPRIYLHPQVCGTISAEFVRKYANEDRATLKPSIVDDPDTFHFIRILEHLAPDVQRALELKLDASPPEETYQADIASVITMLEACYPSDKRGPVHKRDEDERVKPDGGVSTQQPRNLWLELAHEFEPGEPIDISVHFSEELAKRYSVKDIQWRLDRSRAKRTAHTPKGILLEATDLGTGIVSADLVGSSFVAKAEYQIVHKRVFRLSAARAQITCGDSFVLMAVNADKLPSGKIAWTCSGKGRLEATGGSTRYYGTDVGTAVIDARDAVKKTPHAQCEVTITQQEERLFRVRDQYFHVETFLIDRGHGERSRPVNIIKSGQGEFHTMIINALAPGYVKAQERGIGAMYLLAHIAQEFARFSALELQDQRIEGRDVSPLTGRIAADGDELFAEFLSGAIKT